MAYSGECEKGNAVFFSKCHQTQENGCLCIGRWRFLFSGMPCVLDLRHPFSCGNDFFGADFIGGNCICRCGNCIGRYGGKSGCSARGQRFDNIEGKRDGNYRQHSVLEYIEVYTSESGILLWKATDSEPRKETDFVFYSSFGIFHSIDHGEFGGTLTTPKETLYGNFSNIIEFNGKVYAIDSLNHMGIRHSRIIEFDNQLNHKTIFETDPEDRLSLVAITIEKDRILLLISGALSGNTGSFEDSKDYSVLLEITKNGLNRIAEFEFDLHYVNNLLLKNHTLIIGMNKLIAVIDTETKEINAYTPLTIEAEDELRRTNGNTN